MVAAFLHAAPDAGQPGPVALRVLFWKRYIPSFFLNLFPSSRSGTALRTVQFHSPIPHVPVHRSPYGRVSDKRSDSFDSAGERRDRTPHGSRIRTPTRCPEPTPGN